MVELKSMTALQSNFPLKIGGISVCEVQTSLITVGIGKKIPKPLVKIQVVGLVVHLGQPKKESCLMILYLKVNFQVYPFDF